MRGETILIIDDEKLIRWSLRQELASLGFHIVEAENLLQAKEQFEHIEPDLIILDQKLPDGTGINFLEWMQPHIQTIPVIVFTAFDRSEVAVQSLKLGAFDYITKPVNFDELKIVIEKALESTKLKRQVQHFLKEQQNNYGFCGLIGSSSPMKKVCNAISKIAQSSSTVLITGESGTGKELAAKAVHFLSKRREKPLLTVNFSALTESLIESELFGHEKGAFTDARNQKKGLFELADGGTIFLDEIGDISPKIQVKLLRVIEQKTFQRVGGSNDITVDVRIITATNKQLEKLVQDGTFRSDLYFRLNVAQITMPPLRERKDDIILLAEYFLTEFNTAFHKKFKGISEDAKKLFLAHQWTGNVRELRNVIERAVLMDDGEYIFSHNVELGHFHTISPNVIPEVFEVTDTMQSLEDAEKKILLRALEQTHQNQSEAARILKISRDTLRYRMKKYGLN
ncbi:MAG: sigma-54 dependent transcriptional regulator [Bacteroidota bacterium]